MSEYSMPSYFQSMPVIGKDLRRIPRGQRR